MQKSYKKVQQILLISLHSCPQIHILTFLYANCYFFFVKVQHFKILSLLINITVEFIVCLSANLAHPDSTNYKTKVGVNKLQY